MKRRARRTLASRKKLMLRLFPLKRYVPFIMERYSTLSVAARSLTSHSGEYSS